MPKLTFDLRERHEFENYWMFKETPDTNENTINGVYVRKDACSALPPQHLRITIEWS